MKNRTELAKYFAELDFKIGAEIGVCDGYYSEILCQNIPNLKLYAIDSWMLYDKYRNFARKSEYKKIYEDAQKLLAPYDCVLIKKLSMEAIKDFEDESLDFVYIDANHAYEFVKEDIREWSKKVRKSGIISGHDYYITKSGNTGVVDAVNEYVKEYNLKLLTTDWDRTTRHKDDRQPSWYFVKL